MEKLNVLKQCTINGNIVKLPAEQLDRKLYQDVAKSLEGIGGKWNKKQGGFLFDNDPTELLAEISGGVKRNIKKEFQAFFTPEDIADWMAQNLFVEPNDSILEPNGGGGALIKAVRKEGHANKIHTCELNPIYSDELKKMQDVIFLGADFLAIDRTMRFNKIIANPPFNKNQDIDHIYKMWDLLEPKGRIVTVCSNHWTFANGKKEKTFREWVEEVEGVTYPLDSGKFKSSGTMVSSQILVIDK